MPVCPSYMYPYMRILPTRNQKERESITKTSEFICTSYACVCNSLKPNEITQMQPAWPAFA